MKKSLRYSILGLLIIIISWFLGRNILLNHLFYKVTTSVENKFALKTTVKSIHFQNFMNIHIDSFLITKDSIPIIEINKLKITPTIFFLFNHRISSLSIYDASISADFNDLRKWYQLYKKPTSDTSQAEPLGYRKYSRLASRILNLIPNSIDLYKVRLNYKSNANYLSITIDSFVLKRKVYEGFIKWNDYKNSSECKIAGSIDDPSYNISIVPLKNKSIIIPYITTRLKTTAIFDTLQANLLIEESGKEDDLKIQGKIINFKILNYRVSPDSVIFKKLSANIAFKIADKYIEVDSSSRYNLNNLAFYSYFKLEKNRNRLLSFNIKTDTIHAMELIKAMPEGLFESVRNMKLRGDVQFSLRFNLNLDNPDDIYFKPYMYSKKTGIDRYGSAQLFKLNEEFMYEAYSTNGYERSIVVGNSNPDFSPIGTISPHLIYSVLTSEDGSFYYHNGFNIDALASSISTNIKRNRFARGGSTITMQLVKNVFLTRNKTISRKLEEIFMVWLIEQHHVCSKERMLEVYFNIIEWGPGIYGVKDACNFYFKKHPSAINLNEAIFMASIIPKPRYFYTSFDSTSTLKPFMKSYYEKVAEIMLRRQQILASDTVNLNPNVVLTGAATEYLKKKEILSLDSTQSDLPIDEIPLELFE